MGWDLVLKIIGSFGGSAVIIAAVVKYASDLIAERLKQKYKADLSKELEEYKSKLGNKNYISKTRFEAEFKIYQELLKVFAEMVKNTNLLFPTFTKDSRDDKDTYKEHHDLALDSIVIVQDMLNSTSAFIPEELYSSFCELEELCKIQLSDFQDFRLRPDAEDYKHDCNDEYRHCYKRTREINDKHKLIIKELREYLAKLDVLE